jgi:hypothetical protein
MGSTLDRQGFDEDEQAVVLRLQTLQFLCGWNQSAYQNADGLVETNPLYRTYGGYD